MNIKKFCLTLTMLAVSLSAQSQGDRSANLKKELDSEVASLYTTAGGEKQDKQVVIATALPPPKIEEIPVVTMPAPSTQVYNAQPSQNLTTYVESSPLDESKATRMRRQREGIEAETEMRIVEKLEQDRMESEKARSERLFGDRFNNQNQSAQVMQQAPVQYVDPRVESMERELEKEDFKQDLRDIVGSLKVKEEAVEVADPKDFYFIKGTLGVGSYPGVNNISDGGFKGIAFGVNNWNDVSIEMFVDVAKYEYRICGSYCGGGLNSGDADIDQFTLGIAAKKVFMNTSRLQPSIGAVFSFAKREYTMAGNYSSSDVATSQSLDLGGMAGLDLAIGKYMSVGLDVRYMFNLYNKLDRSSTGYGFYGYGTTFKPIEELQYTIVGMNIKLGF